MTMTDVTARPAGSVTDALGVDTTAEFRPVRMTTMPTQWVGPVPVTDGPTVPGGPVPGHAVVDRGTGKLDSAASEWTAWYLVEIDRGSHWEAVARGDTTIAEPTAAALDELVAWRIGVGVAGEPYAVARVSAGTVTSDGAPLVAYDVQALPLMHRTTKAATT